MLRTVVTALLFALPSLATLPLPESAATAATAPTAAAVDVDALTSIVKQQVITPLHDREINRSKMSRAAMPPQERRVRIIDAALRTDDKGHSFVAFAIDTKFGRFNRGITIRVDEHGDLVSDNSHADEWTRDAMTGCVYASGAVFVGSGDSFRSAKSVTTAKKKKSKSAEEAPAHICRDRTAQVAALQ